MQKPGRKQGRSLYRWQKKFDPRLFNVQGIKVQRSRFEVQKVKSPPERSAGILPAVAGAACPHMNAPGFKSLRKSRFPCSRDKSFKDQGCVASATRGF
jgi:hypothetical protein